MFEKIYAGCSVSKHLFYNTQRIYSGMYKRLDHGHKFLFVLVILSVSLRFRPINSNWCMCFLIIPNCNYKPCNECLSSSNHPSCVYSLIKFVQCVYKFRIYKKKLNNFFSQTHKTQHPLMCIKYCILFQILDQFWLIHYVNVYKVMFQVL